MPLMSNLNVNGNDYEIKDAAARGDISTLQTSKEAVANKVTSISNTSTDTQYPSAKAVYDYVQNNTDWAEIIYGTTTKEEIAALITAGKRPYFIYNNDKLFILNVETAAVYNFTSPYVSDQMVLYGFSMFKSSGNWYSYSYTSTTTVSSSSTNSLIPTAKAVYDFVTGIANTKQNKLYKHAIGFNRATGSTVELFSIKMFLTNSSDDPNNTPAALLDVMAVEYGPNVNLPASGYFLNASSETVQVLHMNANPYAYGGIGAFNAYGINTSTGLYEGREFINAGADIDVSDTVTGV